MYIKQSPLVISLSKFLKSFDQLQSFLIRMPQTELPMGVGFLKMQQIEMSYLWFFAIQRH